MLTIFIEKLILEGIHGVTAREQERSQPFQVDIKIKTTVTPGGADTIQTTLDYRAVKKIVESIICDEQHSLLETIANRIACAIRSNPLVRSVKVTVRKLTIWPNGIPGVTIEL